MAMIFVFLVLAAVQESQPGDASVLLGLPIHVFGVLGASFLHLENNVYADRHCHLMGLAAKNAILIVSSPRRITRKETGLVVAATEGAKLRFRPIMTALAFILGVLSGARQRVYARLASCIGIAGIFGHVDGFHRGTVLHPHALRFDSGAWPIRWPGTERRSGAVGVALF